VWPTASVVEQEQQSNSDMRLELVPARATHSDVNSCAESAMERYARGDDSAFAEVYDAIASRIHRYLLRQTKNPSLADDLLQQTLLQIHRKRGTYSSGCAVLPWAFAIARRLHIDAHRQGKRDALSSSCCVPEQDHWAEWSLDDEVMSRETAWIVERELARMPENHRTAFELLRVDGLSHDEAAQILGTTVNAVKLRAFRAYAALRAALASDLDHPSVAEPPI
jgi:RNA polymerase sigma-70 factor (ECF subfamily)